MTTPRCELTVLMPCLNEAETVTTCVRKARGWLDAAGVDTSAVRVSDTRHTARFVCTTDSALAQISSFYPGAMSEADTIDLAEHGDFDLVLISPDDPAAMVRHTASCRDRGVPFAADPSQQLAFADGEMIRGLIDGATYLFSNDYESALIEKKTGWTSEEVRSRVSTQVTTRERTCLLYTSPSPRD